MPSKCSSCGADIEWSMTERGKAVPLNKPPEKRFIMFFKPGCPEYVKLVETWLSHFATCPNAKQHRR